MACKDCIHFESCKNLYETHGEGLSGDSYVCDFFKDRSRFVELPCKLGDVIFCTTMGKIHQGIVGRIELDNEGFAIITTDGYCFDSSICYHTQEEAEKAVNVKERENNV